MAHHLVILKKAYLDRILDGSKTVECRLSCVRLPPYGSVRRGDTLWLKQSGHWIRGTARVRSVRYFHPLDRAMLALLKERYSRAIGADRSFFRWKKQRRFATVIRLSQVRDIAPIAYPKSDRRAWVVLPGPSQDSDHLSR